MITTNSVEEKCINLGRFSKIDTWAGLLQFFCILITFAFILLVWKDTFSYNYVFLPLMVVFISSIILHCYGHKLKLIILNNTTDGCILLIKEKNKTLFQSNVKAEDIAIRPMVKHPLAKGAMTEVYEIIILLNDLPESITSLHRYKTEQAIILDTIVLYKDKAIEKAAKIQAFIDPENKTPPKFLPLMSYYG